MPFDVLIVGGGPAGLAASIKLKQLAGDSLSVCVIDKGSEIGSHILSGNVFDPSSLNELFPDKDWKEEVESATGSIATPVTADEFLVLTETSSFTIPNLFLPPQLNNHGNYVISLSQLCRWMAQQAEELGVEIYPGFAAADVIIEEGIVRGIRTRDVGLAKDGQPKPTFEPGVELRARQTLFAEGARGSCTEHLMDEFNLRKGPQTYGLGIKEVWQVPKEQHRPGFVQHTLGWPLQSSIFSKTFGGSFLYHQEPDLVLVGVVVGLDYQNPYLNPYQEFQRWKTHPAIRPHLEGGECISYGARVLNEGGYHSIPTLTMPGSLILGCGAGFLNAVKIKGTHTAIRSGILAAEATHEALTSEGVDPVAETFEITTPPPHVKAYQEKYEASSIKSELYEIRNTHEAFARWGVGPGLIYTGLSTFITKGREPWTLAHNKIDADATAPAKGFSPIQYPAPDGKLTFDLLTNLQRSGVYHAEDQPIHLRVKPELQHVPTEVSLPQYAAPESRFCPAGVYEYVDEKLVINSQNCVHCKCCGIKTPREYIRWTVPEGGGGPQYQVM
ncbi:electron-transferring-flavoprotein dehydrogenase [Fistulifera solaris]|uniref:Electron transfer flavoprotein-ubiquinone oxidoreductase n=1 Tax=Fistulifera solaris TaxID=1519565 RepID=A0A1Z5KIQ7_FISSO|nr:electron-transferring-flavoprotein dehydrogenase [Fistulifera solaris]|eukprot:GAX26190.1 electron-transferring-flavoprotein dehydrogenase [Fistulifera solaris]